MLFFRLLPSFLGLYCSSFVVGESIIFTFDDCHCHILWRLSACEATLAFFRWNGFEHWKKYNRSWIRFVWIFLQWMLICADGCGSFSVYNFPNVSVVVIEASDFTKIRIWFSFKNSQLAPFWTSEIWTMWIRLLFARFVMLEVAWEANRIYDFCWDRCFSVKEWETNGVFSSVSWLSIHQRRWLLLTVWWFVVLFWGV